jgi:hypothetical protein
VKHPSHVEIMTLMLVQKPPTPQHDYDMLCHEQHLTFLKVPIHHIFVAHFHVQLIFSLQIGHYITKLQSSHLVKM